MPTSTRQLLFDIDGTIVDYRTGNATCFLERIRELFVSSIAVHLAIRHAEALAKWNDFTNRQLVWWDYSDIIAEFHLPCAFIWQEMRRIHAEELLIYDDAVQALHALSALSEAPRLHIVSNNPHTGCLLKLERAGLASLEQSKFFGRIFGTNVTRGMKFTPGTWEKIKIALNSDGSNLVTIGDNPKEDAEIPQQSGIGRSFLIQRQECLPETTSASSTEIIHSCNEIISCLELS